MNPNVDQYLLDGCGRCDLVGTPKCKVNTWRSILQELRQLVLSCGLTEEYKWSQPCYTYQGKNILIVTAFKNHASINFFKGALLKDEKSLLISAGENSRAARQLRFTDLNEVATLHETIKAYIFEALEIEKKGLSIPAIKHDEVEWTAELQTFLRDSPELKKAFEALTPGRQRAYNIYFSQPKQAKTRVSRIEKYIPKILAGKGFHDR